MNNKNQWVAFLGCSTKCNFLPLISCKLLKRFTHKLQLAALVLMYFIMFGAIGYCLIPEIAEARISPIPCPECIQVILPNCYNNIAIEARHEQEFFLAKRATGVNASKLHIDNVGENTWRNESFRSSLRKFWGFILEPFISLCQCVVPNENHAAYMGFKRRRFSEVRETNVDLYGLIRSIERFDLNRHNIRPLVHPELLSHFRQLKMSYNHSSQSGDRDGSSEENHPFIFRLHRPFRYILGGLLTVAAYATCWFAVWLIWRRWNRNAALVGALLLALAATLVHYAYWILFIA